jgi:hypothetical protein
MQAAHVHVLASWCASELHSKDSLAYHFTYATQLPDSI